RFAPWTTITRSHTAEPTQDGLEIYRRVQTLLDRALGTTGSPLDRAVRLIGVSVSHLGAAAAGQLQLLDPAAVRRERLAHVVDRLAKRFGDDVVKPASLL